MKMTLSLILLAALLCGTAAFGASAPSAYVPPAKDEAVRAAAIYALPPAWVEACLSGGYPTFVFAEYAGANAELEKSARETSPLIIATGFETALEGAAFFGGGMPDNGQWVFVGAVQSLDATAVRLLVDLRGLGPEDTAWVVAPDALRAHGPFTAADHVEGGRWLPTIFGETAVLIVRTPVNAPPALDVLACSHFFTDFMDAGKFDCPIEAACPTEDGFQDATTAVGMLIIPIGSGQGQCSGALIATVDPVPLEPYFLTANHCFSSGTPPVQNVQVIWDYRAANCDGSGVPNRNTRPTSAGSAYLAKSGAYDGFLLELQSVPPGDLGRLWLGWTTRPPVVGEAVACIHHPAGKPLKASFGRVTNVGVNTGLGDNQTRVNWREGITEQGSSGSPLLLRDQGFQIIGMLSNGNTHNCATPDNNIDNYASFRDFFPAIRCYLVDGEQCEDLPEPSWCPAKAAFEGDPLALAHLRAFRDRVLASNETGRRITAAYYAAAPALARWVRASSVNRTLFAAAATPFVHWGAALEVRH